MCFIFPEQTLQVRRMMVPLRRRTARSGKSGGLSTTSSSAPRNLPNRSIVLCEIGDHHVGDDALKKNLSNLKTGFLSFFLVCLCLSQFLSGLCVCVRVFYTRIARVLYKSAYFCSSSSLLPPLPHYSIALLEFSSWKHEAEILTLFSTERT